MNKLHTQEFTEFELKAAYEACCNYTPKTKRWKQRAQTNASEKILMMLMSIEHEHAEAKRKAA